MPCRVPILYNVLETPENCIFARKITENGPVGGGISFCRRQGDTLFTAQRYASALYAVIMCPSVRPSSTSLYCIETTGHIKLVLA